VTSNQSLLSGHRACTFDVRTRSGPFYKRTPTDQELQQLIAADPFGFQATVQNRYLPWMGHFLESAWYSDLQHRVVVLVAILIFFHRSIPANTVDLASECGHILPYAMNQISKFARRSIEPSNPLEAEIIRTEYLSGFMKHSGTDHSEEGKIRVECLVDPLV